MLRLDRLCVYIIIVGLACLVPGVILLKFIDELIFGLFGLIAVVDLCINKHWFRYKLLWILIAIMTFYAVYSLTIVHFNVPAAIIVDWIIELKPFVPFVVILAIAPKFTEKDKLIIKRICFFNCLVMSVSLLCGNKVTEFIVFHVAYAGIIIFVSSMFYLYCSQNENGQISKRTFWAIVAFMTMGLLCLRSKYYGEYVLFIFFMFLYKPGMLRGFSLKHILIVMSILGVILAASWQKINFYFISGNGESFDPKVVESFARPVLYFTGFAIMGEFVPFGSGLGSFASFASSKYYSDVYYYYGINNVHGIAPNQGFDFICDSFYPSLAQFGLFGVGLFIWFWVYAYSFLRRIIRVNPSRYKYQFIVGSLIICFILIESVAATTFTQAQGQMAMCLLGLACATGRQLKASEASEPMPEGELQPAIKRI